MAIADKIRKKFALNAPHIFEMPAIEDIGIIADAVGTLMAKKPVKFDTKGWKVEEVPDYWHNDEKRREFRIYAPKERAAVEAVGNTGHVTIEKHGIEQNITVILYDE